MFRALVKGFVSRGLPQEDVDSDTYRSRFGRYGECYNPGMLLPGKYALADEGCYFTGNNQTPGTAALPGNTAVGTFNDTSFFFMFYNTERDPIMGKRIYLDYIRWTYPNSPPASVIASASMNLVLKKSRKNREPTNGARTLITPINVASASTQRSISRTMIISTGGPTMPASASDDPIVTHVTIPLGSVVNNGVVLTAKFGGESQKSMGGLTGQANSPGNFVGFGAPVIVEPGEWLVVHRWFTGESSQGQIEWDLGWWER